MSRSSLSGRSRPLVFVTAVALLALVLGLQPARSFAAKAPSAKQKSHGAIASETGKLVAQYTTAYSNTYQLPNGHMLTRVAALPRTGRGRAGSQPSTARAVQAAFTPMTRGSGGGEDELACTIESAAPTKSECDASSLRAGAEPFVHPERSVHSLLQFSLPNLHNNVKVLDAKLGLYETASTTSEAVNMSVYRSLTAWSAGVTWDTTNGSTPWETPGGDYVRGNNIDSVPAQVGTSKGWHYWYPTGIVQKWLNGPTAPRGEGDQNLGLLLADELEGETTNVVTFAGRGQADAPALTIEWVPRGVGAEPSYTMLPASSGTATSLEVNVASGDLVAHSTDLKIPSRGNPFEVARTFNGLSPEAFGYGAGWMDANTPHIEIGQNGAVSFTSATGNTYVFDREGVVSGKPVGLRTPPELESGPERAVLCENGVKSGYCPGTLPDGATYDLWFLAQEIQLLFKGTTGTLYPLAIEYIGEEFATASYKSGLTLPTSWTDTAKQPVTYTESSTLGYTKAAFEPQGESVSYTEKPNKAGTEKLVEYTNKGKQITKYAYGTGTQEEQLTEIVEPSGGPTIKITYNSTQQVTSVEQIPFGGKSGPTTTYTYYEAGKAPSPCTATQKATVVTETEGNEEPTLIYCANVLDEVENVSGYSGTGQAGWYTLEEEADSETETASVNLATGNLLLKSEDITPNAETQNMSVNRFYNSQSSPIASTLGPRWRWGTGPSVYLVNKGAIVVLHGPSGYTVVLKPTSESTYSGPEEFEGTLTKNANGTYTLTNQDNPTYQFNAAGILTSETTEEGNSFTVNDTTLSGKSVLHSLAPASGKAFEVTYNATPQVTQTTDPAGHVRKYAYNSSGQLSSYTTPAGAKTEYGYESSTGYLNKITTPDGTVEKITIVSGKVSETSYKPPSGEASGAKFSYQVPTSPCNPATDAGETVVTSLPTGETQTVCYDALGHFTGPKTETEEAEEGEGEAPEIPAGACYEKPEPPADCGEEDLPPETETRAPTKGIADLKGTSYGIADNNWLRSYPPDEEEEKHIPPQVPNGTFFNYPENHSIQSLTVTRWRRTIPWDIMLNVEAGENQAKVWLSDLEKWIGRVKELGGQPLVSFDACPSDRTWEDPEISEDSKDDLPCSQAPNKKVYAKAVEKFVEHAVLNEVKYFTAFNEPNNAGSPVEKQGKLAGEYWQALDGLCNPNRNHCYVAAGDFSDVGLGDVFHKTLKKGKTNPAFVYFQEYLKGMNHPTTGYRWAWHSYQEGEETQRRYHGGSPQRWWAPFKNFVSAINRAAEHAKFKPPEVWLTEQGVVYERLEKGKPTKNTAAGRTSNPAPGNEILKAYVEHGGSQLTRQSKQITRFYYYSTRGDKNFDSGLLEGEPALRGKPPSSTRSIYNIYKKKTTKRP